MSLWDWAADRARTGTDVHAVAKQIGAPADGMILAAPPAAEHPARIYAYFHGGPDTTSYQQAQRTAQALTGALAAHADGVDTAVRALSAGWTGPAADAARAALAPLRGTLDRLTETARGGAAQLGAQLVTFHDTRHRVVPVPREAPQAGGLDASTTPAAMVREVSADAVASGYQADAQANQRAYSGYTAATVPQAGGLGAPAGGLTAPVPVAGGRRRRWRDEDNTEPMALGELRGLRPPGDPHDEAGPGVPPGIG